MLNTITFREQKSQSKNFDQTYFRETRISEKQEFKFMLLLHEIPKLQGNFIFNVWPLCITNIIPKRGGAKEHPNFTL